MVNPDANREWRRMLASVAGVYLILDTETGYQYIGAATGKDGIWGRWSKYISDGTGGNKLLQDLVKEDERKKYDFQFSVLKISLSPPCRRKYWILRDYIKECWVVGLLALI